MSEPQTLINMLPAARGGAPHSHTGGKAHAGRFCLGIHFIGSRREWKYPSPFSLPDSGKAGEPGTSLKTDFISLMIIAAAKCPWDCYV